MTRPMRLLTERENERAVELIEMAERSAPYCQCGSHMIAVARGDEIWLECATRSQEPQGLGALLTNLMSLGHTRRLIMELPTAD
jgi:hypothetical protein